MGGRSRGEWIANATAQLQDAGINSARLDAELLLTHALDLPRTAIHAHPEIELPESITPVLDAMLSLRIIRVPIAYIIGHREFYGRLFKVTPSVLIPRPETEDIVSLLLELPPADTIIDVGTGSGALAVTLALEYPHAQVYATDISSRALTVAETNASTYAAAVNFLKSDLLSGFSDLSFTGATTIVANLPYVDEADTRSPETDHEPAEALFANDAGMALIDRLIEQSTTVLHAGDYLLLESNPEQQVSIAITAQKNGFAVTRTRHLISVLRRD